MTSQELIQRITKLNLVEEEVKVAHAAHQYKKKEFMSYQNDLARELGIEIDIADSYLKSEFLQKLGEILLQEQRK